MLQLGIRGFSHFTILNPYPSSHLYTDESKKGLAKFLLISIFTVNGFCAMMHLVFGLDANPVNGYLYGGMTIQFIGETRPIGRLEVFAYDVMMFLCQLILHNLMCFVDDSEILSVTTTRAETTDDLMTKPYDYSDGYNGNVVLMAIDIVKGVRTIMSYTHLGIYDSNAVREGPFNYRVPGGFDT